MAFCSHCGSELGPQRTCPRCGQASSVPVISGGVAGPAKSSAAVIIIAAVVGLFFFAGIAAAIAIPNFLKMQAKAKQSEAKTNLGAVFTGQVAFHGENDAYGKTFDEITWQPEGRNIYTYYMCGDKIEASDAPAEGLPPGLATICDQDRFLAVAVGDIDNDATLDVWTINELKELSNVTNDIIQ
jgi:type IV pilus assembly protein PilA